jgi:iron complex outermembrane receptor protein
MANRLGVMLLGGAINFTLPTGSSSPRTKATNQHVSVNGNVGIELSENVTTRFFAGYTDLGFDVAGPVDLVFRPQVQRTAPCSS